MMWMENRLANRTTGSILLHKDVYPVVRFREYLLCFYEFPLFPAFFAFFGLTTPLFGKAAAAFPDRHHMPPHFFLLL